MYKQSQLEGYKWQNIFILGISRMVGKLKQEFNWRLQNEIHNKKEFCNYRQVKNRAGNQTALEFRLYDFVGLKWFESLRDYLT